MTVLSRGARSRRGGRRPGWTLLTALLVLAVAASSALVFTNRTELLKLAVILALWAAVVAAFASVIYRRQSDIDHAKARDLKLVYDLQLDREIAARREYELEVETQLRRELTEELHAQAADEVAALRAELAALRTNLEILFEADLAHRPAIETERTTVRAYSDWARDTDQTDPGSVARGRFTASTREDIGAREDHIIDVPEEPPEPEQPLGWPAPEEPPEPEQPLGWRAPTEEPPSQRPSGLYVPPTYGGAHRRPSEQGSWEVPPQPVSPPAEAEPTVRPEPPRQPAEAEEWQPVAAQGQWLPPGTPGSNWVSAGTPGSNWESAGNGFSPPEFAAESFAPESFAAESFAAEAPPVTTESRRGRHATDAEPAADSAPPQQPVPVHRQEYGLPDYGVAAPSRGARHSADTRGQSADTRSYAATPPADTFPSPAPQAPGGPAARHRGVGPAPSEGQHGQGQSVAELLARLQRGGASEAGGRRRRGD
jgi:hypothetical protein